jgi:hypothetical protein
LRTDDKAIQELMKIPLDVSRVERDRENRLAIVCGSPLAAACLITVLTDVPYRLHPSLSLSSSLDCLSLSILIIVII